MATMQIRVDIVEPVPNMADDHPAEFILGHDAVDDKAKGHQHPREIGRREHQHAQKAEARVGVAATPDVDEAGGQRGAHKGHGEQWRYA